MLAPGPKIKEWESSQKRGSHVCIKKQPRTACFAQWQIIQKVLSNAGKIKLFFCGSVSILRSLFTWLIHEHILRSMHHGKAYCIILVQLTFYQKKNSTYLNVNVIRQLSKRAIYLFTSYVQLAIVKCSKQCSLAIILHSKNRWQGELGKYAEADLCSELTKWDYSSSWRKTKCENIIFSANNSAIITHLGKLPPGYPLLYEEYAVQCGIKYLLGLLQHP